MEGSQASDIACIIAGCVSEPKRSVASRSKAGHSLRGTIQEAYGCDFADEGNRERDPPSSTVLRPSAHRVCVNAKSVGSTLRLRIRTSGERGRREASNWPEKPGETCSNPSMKSQARREPGERIPSDTDRASETERSETEAGNKDHHDVLIAEVSDASKRTEGS